MKTKGAADSGAAHETSEDLSAVLLRRLGDEDPQVVVSVTDHDVLLQRALLGLPDQGPDSVHDEGSLSTRAALVASTVVSASVPWLASLSEDRPKYPVASAGRVLCGLIRTASAACSAVVAGAVDDVEAVAARNAALRLFFECLPGPHANARVKFGQAAASSGVSRDGAIVTGKARKKALRAVARSAVEAVCRLEGGRTMIFDGVGKVLEQADGDKMKEGVIASSKKGKGRSKRNEMGVQESAPVKSKGLKVMGDELCDILAGAIAKGDGQDILQVGKISRIS